MHKFLLYLFLLSACENEFSQEISEKCQCFSGKQHKRVFTNQSHVDTFATSWVFGLSTNPDCRLSAHSILTVNGGQSVSLALTPAGPSENLSVTHSPQPHSYLALLIIDFLKYKT